MSFLRPIATAVGNIVIKQGFLSLWKEMTGKTVEQKIKKLKELRAEGSITEDQYQSLISKEIGDIK